ncbi:hypothetical protein ACA910_015029 [Epithemia clementina (nom. ined.)]
MPSTKRKRRTSARNSTTTGAAVDEVKQSPSSSSCCTARSSSRPTPRHHAAPRGNKNSDNNDKNTPSLAFWNCPFCTLQNPCSRRRCGACQARKPVATTTTITTFLQQEPPPQQQQQQQQPPLDVSSSVDNLLTERENSETTRRTVSSTAKENSHHNSSASVDGHPASRSTTDSSHNSTQEEGTLTQQRQSSILVQTWLNERRKRKRKRNQPLSRSSASDALSSSQSSLSSQSALFFSKPQSTVFHDYDHGGGSFGGGLADVRVTVRVGGAPFHVDDDDNNNDKVHDSNPLLESAQDSSFLTVNRHYLYASIKGQGFPRHNQPQQHTTTATRTSTTRRAPQPPRGSGARATTQTDDELLLSSSLSSSAMTMPTQPPLVRVRIVAGAREIQDDDDDDHKNDGDSFLYASSWMIHHQPQQEHQQQQPNRGCCPLASSQVADFVLPFNNRKSIFEEDCDSSSLQSNAPERNGTGIPTGGKNAPVTNDPWYMRTTNNDTVAVVVPPPLPELTIDGQGMNDDDGGDANNHTSLVPQKPAASVVTVEQRAPQVGSFVLKSDGECSNPNMDGSAESVRDDKNENGFESTVPERDSVGVKEFDTPIPLVPAAVVQPTASPTKVLHLVVPTIIGPQRQACPDEDTPQKTAEYAPTVDRRAPQSDTLMDETRQRSLEKHGTYSNPSIGDFAEGLDDDDESDKGGSEIRKVHIGVVAKEFDSNHPVAGAVVKVAVSTATQNEEHDQPVNAIGPRNEPCPGDNPNNQKLPQELILDDIASKQDAPKVLRETVLCPQSVRDLNKEADCDESNGVNESAPMPTRPDATAEDGPASCATKESSVQFCSTTRMAMESLYKSTNASKKTKMDNSTESKRNETGSPSASLCNQHGRQHDGTSIDLETTTTPKKRFANQQQQFEQQLNNPSSPPRTQNQEEEGEAFVPPTKCFGEKRQILPSGISMLTSPPLLTQQQSQNSSLVVVMSDQACSTSNNVLVESTCPTETPLSAPLRRDSSGSSKTASDRLCSWRPATQNITQNSFFSYTQATQQSQEDESQTPPSSVEHSLQYLPSRESNLFSTEQQGQGHNRPCPSSPLFAESSFPTPLMDRQFNQAENNNDAQQSATTPSKASVDQCDEGEGEAETNTTVQQQVPVTNESFRAIFQTAGRNTVLQASSEDLLKAEKLLRESTQKERFSSNGSATCQSITNNSRRPQNEAVGDTKAAVVDTRKPSIQPRVAFFTAGRNEELQISIENLSKAEDLLRGSPDKQNDAKERSIPFRNYDHTRRLGRRSDKFFSTTNSENVRRLDAGGHENCKQSGSLVQTATPEQHLRSTKHMSSWNGPFTKSRTEETGAPCHASQKDCRRPAYPHQARSMQQKDRNVSISERQILACPVTPAPSETVLRMANRKAAVEKHLTNHASTAKLIPKPVLSEIKPVESCHEPERSQTAAVAFRSAGTGKSLRVSEAQLLEAHELLLRPAGGGKTADNLRSKGTIPNASSEECHGELRTDEVGNIYPVAVSFGSAGSAKTLHAKGVSLSRANARCNKPEDTTPPLVVAFQSAGTGKRLHVSDENLARANDLLNRRDEPSACLRAFSNVSSGQAPDLSKNELLNANATGLLNEHEENPVAHSRAPRVSFESAGTGRTISVSESDLSRASDILNKPGETRKLPSRVSIESAGTRRTIDASENELSRASDLLNQPGNTIARPPRVSFESAGTGRTLDESESDLSKAAFLLRKPSENNSECRSKVLFHAAGTRRALDLPDEDLSKAADILEKSSDETRARPNRASCQSAGSTRTLDLGDEDTGNAIDLLNNDRPGKTKTRPPRVSFESAGTGRTISVLESDVSRASDILNKPGETRKLPSRVSFESAGTRRTIDASENELSRASDLLNQPGNMIARPPRVSSESAGTGSALDESESDLSQAAFLLRKPSENNSECRSKVSFHAADTGRAFFVSDEDLSKAADILENSSDETRARPNRASCQSAGSTRTLDVGDEDTGNAIDLLNNDRPGKTKTRPPRVSFESAGTGRKIDVSEWELSSASDLLNKPVEARARLPRVSFESAGAGRTLDVFENDLSRAPVLLSESRENKEYSGPRNLFLAAGNGKTHDRTRDVCDQNLSKAADLPNESREQTRVRPSRVLFQSAGSGRALDVSDEDLNSATDLLNKSGKTTRTSRVSFESAGISKTLDVSDEGDFSEEGRVIKARSSRVSLETARGKVNGSETKFLLDQQDAINCCPARVLLPISERCIPSLVSKGNNNQLTPDQQNVHTLQCPNGTLNPAPSKESFVSDDFPLRDDKKMGVDSPQILRVDECPVWNENQPSINDQPKYDTKRASRLGTECSSPFIPTEIFPENSDSKASAVEFISLSTPPIGSKVISPVNGSSDFAADAAVPFPDQDEVLVGQEKDSPIDNASSTADLSSSKANSGHLLEADIRRGLMSGVGECKIYGVHDCIIAANSANAESIRFDRSTGNPCDQGQTDSIGSHADFRLSLEKTGCDGSKISDRWLRNHCRWINWKLCSIERRFPRFLSNRFFTYSRVLGQLRTRYRKEFEEGKRSAIRQVLNQDASSKRMIILCIARVFSNQSEDPPSFSLELTDGWYSILARPDKFLSTKIAEGRLCEGVKLALSQAELCGSDEGIDPLDDSYVVSPENASLYLRISANGSRIAHWRAKLGFVPEKVKDREPLSMKIQRLSDVVVGGGVVPLIDLCILRRHALQYLTQGEDNPRMSVTEKEEENRRLTFEKRQSSFAERVAAELEDECAKDIDDHAPSIWHKYWSSRDDFDLYALSCDDQKQIEAWSQKRLELLRAHVDQEMKCKLEEHDIVFVPSKPFQRFLVCTPDYLGGKEGNRSTTADLTLWEPTEEQLEALKEGHVVTIRNVAVKESTFEARLQLVANTRTQITSTVGIGMSSIQSKMPDRIGLVKIHALVKRKLTQVLPFSLVAIVVETLVTAIGTHYILTDRSGLVLRLESFEDAVLAPHHLLSSFPILIFQNLTLVDYDAYSNCAVAEFSPDSSVRENKDDPGVVAMQRWLDTEEGWNRLTMLQPYIQAKLKPFSVLETSKSLVEAIGYLTDFVVLSGGHLIVKVDCVPMGIQKWSLPLPLISRLKYLHSQERNLVVLSRCEEQRLAQLSSLDCIVRIKSLLRFVLQRKSGPSSEGQDQYVVVDVSLANVKAVNQLYSQFLRSTLE